MKEIYKGYTIEVEEDSDGVFDPREDDNLGVMVCKHNRYTLGDPKVNTLIPWDTFSSWLEVEAYLTKKFKPILILPLFLYDHSGLSIQTQMHGYHGSWDCGQVGYIFTTKKQQGIHGTPDDLIEKVLLSEVESYSNYLNGEAWQYQIFEGTDPDADMEEIVDMCAGYESEECALDDAHMTVEILISSKQAQPA